MQLALGIGTFLLGGWVLSAPVDEPVTPPASQTAAPSQAPQAGVLQGDQRQMDSAQQREAASQNRLYTGAFPQRPQQSQRQPSAYMPGSPVDPNRPDSPWMPQSPTSLQSANMGNGVYRSAGSQMPDAPTSYRQPAVPSGLQRDYQGYSYDTMMSQRNRSMLEAHPSFGNAPLAPDKPFANGGQRLSSGGVSPYLNLFRTDTAGGTIDNYSTLVKPQLEQRRMNKQFGTDIYGMERANRIQQASLQRLQSNRALQGIGTPQFNSSPSSSSYYPGYGNQGASGAGYGSASYGTGNYYGTGNAYGNRNYYGGSY